MKKKLNLKNAIISAILTIAITVVFCGCAQNQPQANTEEKADLANTQKQPIFTQSSDPKLFGIMWNCTLLLQD